MPANVGIATPDADLSQLAQAIVTVLAVINPAVCSTIFQTLTAKLDAPQKRRAAVTVSLAILAILLTSALIGLRVLEAFGISLDVFRIVGGLIIAYMGLDMLSGRGTVGQAPPAGGEVDPASHYMPLIMFAAGPGTITAVVTLAAVHAGHRLPVTALVASAVGAAVTFVVLLLAIHTGSRLSAGTQAIVTRFMGLIVTSMGLQFVLTGFKAFMQAPV